MISKALLEDINNAVNVLKNEGIVIYPTDTVYGLGVIPTARALNKIYKLKNRDYSKKVIILLANVNKMYDFINLSNETKEDIEKLNKIINKFWPGDLTIVLKASEKIKLLYDGNIETIGLRVPNNDISREIINKSGGALFTTSANYSGEPAPTIFDEISRELMSDVDFTVSNYYSFEEKKGNKPSTVVYFVDGKLELLREGRVTLEMINSVINN